jgi:hypothetical protein
MRLKSHDGPPCARYLPDKRYRLVTRDGKINHMCSNFDRLVRLE